MSAEAAFYHNFGTSKYFFRQKKNNDKDIEYFLYFICQIYERNKGEGDRRADGILF